MACGLTQPTTFAHPAGPSRPVKNKDTRYVDIHEDDQLDEAQLAAWVKQASWLPVSECEPGSSAAARILPLALQFKASFAYMRNMLSN
jgi:hypothetical protein